MGDEVEGILFGLRIEVPSDGTRVTNICTYRYVGFTLYAN